jgi:CBS domain-containing protein
MAPEGDVRRERSVDETKVRDLMLPLQHHATISEEATIQEALVALSKAQLGLTQDRQHLRAILVLSSDGKVVGKLDHLAILRSLETGLLRQDDKESLSRAGLSDDLIDSLMNRVSLDAEGLARLCEQAATVRVKDAMVPQTEGVDEDAALSEAIHRMVTTRARSILVRRQGEVVGVLRLCDVFEEVADVIRRSASSHE